MYIFCSKKVGETMIPTEIKKTEDEFISKLTANGVKYTLKETLDIGNNIKIYSIRPDYDTYYYQTKTTKKWARRSANPRRRFKSMQSVP